MNLYEIKQKLIEKEKAIFSLNEISRIIDKPKNITSVYLDRMCKKSLLFKLEKNKYSTTQDIFIIASQLAYPSYIGLTTSLYLQNEFSQIINKIFVLSPKQKKNITILNTEIQFIKIKPSLMFGYEKRKKENSYIFISNLEKTIIDSFLYPTYLKIPNMLELLEKIDKEKLIEYAKLTKKEVILRKIGLLLGTARIPHDLIRKTKTIYKFNPKIKERGKFNNKWFLYVNEVIK